MKDKRTIIQEFLNVPSPYAQELLRELSEGVKFKVYPPRTRFNTEDNGRHNCFLLRAGAINICADPNDRVISIQQAPAILGFITLLSSAVDFRIYTLFESEIAVISREKAFSVIAEKNLWETYAKHAEIVANRLYLQNMFITAPTSYEILRHLLIDFINQPVNIRHSITVERYVCERSKLSRSGVLKILAKLKEGNHIVIEKGILIGINDLPEEL